MMKEATTNGTRKLGLDIFRILCCIGVLTYHVADDFLRSRLALYIYYSVAFCVPGFFLLAGYMIGMHKNVSTEYCEKKIAFTLLKALGWTTIICVIEMLFGRQNGGGGNFSAY